MSSYVIELVATNKKVKLAPSDVLYGSEAEARANAERYYDWNKWLMRLKMVRLIVDGKYLDSFDGFRWVVSDCGRTLPLYFPTGSEYGGQVYVFGRSYSEGLNVSLGTDLAKAYASLEALYRNQAGVRTITKVVLTGQSANYPGKADERLDVFDGTMWRHVLMIESKDGSIRRNLMDAWGDQHPEFGLSIYDEQGNASATFDKRMSCSGIDVAEAVMECFRDYNVTKVSAFYKDQLVEQVGGLRVHRPSIVAQTRDGRLIYWLNQYDHMEEARQGAARWFERDNAMLRRVVVRKVTYVKVGRGVSRAVFLQDIYDGRRWLSGRPTVATSIWQRFKYAIAGELDTYHNNIR